MTRISPAIASLATVDADTPSSRQKSAFRGNGASVAGPLAASRCLSDVELGIDALRRALDHPAARGLFNSHIRTGKKLGKSEPFRAPFSQGGAANPHYSPGWAGMVQTVERP
jgi:hypothetical protein